MEVEVIFPHGFCSGVAAAIRRAEEVLASARQGEKVYSLHALVHNELVTSALRAQGLRSVEDLAEVPEGGTVILSAHGVAPKVRDLAAARRLKVIDTTCPFVARLHREVKRYAASGVPVVVIGHPEHVEVMGIVGEARAALGEVRVVVSPAEVSALPFPADGEVGVVSQTTLSFAAVAAVKSALAARFSRLSSSPASTVCTATADRQRAVAEFVRGGGDAVLVLGSEESSNTRRLAEVAQAAGAKKVVRAATLAVALAIDFSGIKRLGVTSGASTPETLLEAVVAALRDRTR